MNRRIEDTVLPQKSTENVAFVIGGRGCSIGSMSIFTKEFHEQYVETTGEGTIIVLQPPMEAFARVPVGGDIVFHEIQFGAVINGKRSVKTVEGALWIFGSNSATDFALGRAEARALDDFRRYLGFAGLGISKSLPQEQIGFSLKTLSKGIEEFQGLLRKKELEETELQAFFEMNPAFLCLATHWRLFPRVIMENTDGRKLIPDFLLERVTDNYCDILDIKLPQKRILTGVNARKRFTAAVYDAIAQVRDYREYFEDAGNREEVKRKYGLSVYKPNIMVLIGSDNYIEREELIKIRAQHMDIEIITYDDLLRQVLYLRTLLENSIAEISDHA
jgi:hypothetical protein